MAQPFRFFRFSFDEVAPTVEELLDFIQSSELEKEHPAVIFSKEILQLKRIETEISGGYTIKKVANLQPKTGELTIENTTLSIGRQLGGYIKEASEIALFLCTAGEEFTRMTNTLNDQGDYMEAYILDAIGSLTVEKAMDKIQYELKTEAEGYQLRTSNRYSPGYCNWPLTDQPALFHLIGAHPTKITINDSCLMTPRKSVSGIIGMGQNLKHHKYGCEICSNATCIYRKIIHSSQITL